MPLLIKEVKAMKVGNPAEENTDIGSVISHPHMKKVLSYIDLAKQEGGKIATGGGRIILPKPNSNGAFIEPTIVEGLSIDSRCATEEILGLLLLSINLLVMTKRFEWRILLNMAWQGLFGHQI